MQRRVLVIIVGLALTLGLVWLVARPPKGRPGLPVLGGAHEVLPVAEAPPAQDLQPGKGQIQVLLSLPAADGPVPDAWTAWLLGHSREGLVRRAPVDGVEAGAAASWRSTGPGELSFQLRPELKWSDGQALTAGDFVAAWRARARARGTAPLGALRVLANAERVAAGKDPAETLGVSAEGTDVVHVKLAPDAPALPAVLTAFAAPELTPLAGVEDGGALPADDELRGPFNGPFTPARAGHGFLLQRNPAYWDLAAVGLALITATPTAEAAGPRAAERFLAGEVAFVDRPELAIEALNRVALNVRRTMTGEAVVIALSRKSPALRNAGFRRALRLAINRDDLQLYTARDGGLASMPGLVPPLLPALAAAYGVEYAVTYETGPRLAQALFNKARKELKGAYPKGLRVVAADDPASRAELTHLGQWLAVNHNLPLTVSYLHSGLAVEMAKGAYDLAYVRLTPETAEPLAYLEVYQAAPWRGAVELPDGVRAMLRAARAEPDARRRLGQVSAAERALIEDGYLIGVAQAAPPYLIDARLAGVVRRMHGTDPDFTRAHAAGSVAAGVPQPEAR